VDRLGFVLDMNAAAGHVLGDEVRIRNRRLWVRDQRAQSMLDAFVRQLRATPQSAILPAQPIVVQRRTQRPVVIRFLPVDGPASSLFVGACAILVLTDLDCKSGLQPDVLAQVFGLSPAETRLGVLIATGISPERAAEQLGLARETVRNELKAVFSKTGTHRQNELVALVSKL
jgi:DNA-binding CsgD family transcriptional regulator